MGLLRRFVFQKDGAIAIFFHLVENHAQTNVYGSVREQIGLGLAKVGLERGVKVCKTLIRRFDPDPRLQNIRFKISNLRN